MQIIPIIWDCKDTIFFCIYAKSYQNIFDKLMNETNATVCELLRKDVCRPIIFIQSSYNTSCSHPDNAYRVAAGYKFHQFQVAGQVSFACLIS